MTVPKIRTDPGEGHGLTAALNDVHYRAHERGEPVEDIVAIVKLRCVEHKDKDTAKGRHRTATYEIVRMEPAREDEARRLGMLVEDLYVQRTSKGARVLPLDFGTRPDEERRLELVEAVETWSNAQNLTGGQLDETWREHFGVGQGADATVTGDYHKGSLVQLLDFAHSVGAVAKEIEGDDEPAADDDDAADAIDAAEAPAQAEGDDGWSAGYPEGTKPEPEAALS